jgi:hypothetical protein
LLRGRPLRSATDVLPVVWQPKGVQLSHGPGIGQENACIGSRPLGEPHRLHGHSDVLRRGGLLSRDGLRRDGHAHLRRALPHRWGREGGVAAGRGKSQCSKHCADESKAMGTRQTLEALEDLASGLNRDPVVLLSPADLRASGLLNDLMSSGFTFLVEDRPGRGPESLLRACARSRIRCRLRQRTRLAWGNPRGEALSLLLDGMAGWPPASTVGEQANFIRSWPQTAGRPIPPTFPP